MQISFDKPKYGSRINNDVVIDIVSNQDLPVAVGFKMCCLGLFVVDAAALHHPLQHHQHQLHQLPTRQLGRIV